MAKNKLGDRQIKAAKTKALLSDGGNLYLAVNSETARSWRFIYKKKGKRTEIGLGAYPDVSLAKARDIAADMRGLLADGRDPKIEAIKLKAEKEAEPTFAEMAERLIDNRADEWRNAKHLAQWRSTLGPKYCGPLQDMRVSTIGTADVLATLSPLWKTKPTTASRIRARMEKVFDMAVALQWRGGDNPAKLGVVQAALGSAKRPKGAQINHHAAMAADQLPAFMEALAERDAMAAICLRFIILTAARSGEARGARWDEIDADTATWIVPATRMKAGKEHRVPLSRQAMEIIERLRETRQNDLVFPSAQRGTIMSDMAFSALFRRMGVTGITTHGFRSTFRDWAEELSYDYVAAESSLAHTVGGASERSYRRSDVFEKRRLLMQDWANFCEPLERSNVVEFRGTVS